MIKNQIPTAKFGVFDDGNMAIDYSKSLDYNIVVKADGLASRKGVMVCNGKE